MTQVAMGVSKGPETLRSRTTTPNYVIQSASVTALSVANPDDPKMVGHIAAMELINADLIEVAGDYAYVITPWCLHRRPCQTHRRSISGGVVVVSIADWQSHHCQCLRRRTTRTS